MKEERLFKLNLEKSTLKFFHKLDVRRVLLQMILIFMIYALCAFIVVTPHFEFSAFFLCPFMGFILAGFLNAAHNCVHCTHFLSKKSNRIMGALWCIPVLTNYSIYRYQHLTHHHYTGVDGDTESHRTFSSIKEYFCFLTGIEFWRYVLGLSLKSVKGNFLPTINNKQRRNEVKQDNWMLGFWILLVVVLTFFFPKAMLLIYWIPLCFYAPMVILTSLPEHYGCSRESNIRYNTRTVVTNKFVQFFLWNGNYHAEHHAYPGIPAMNLSYLHKEISNRFYNVEDSYTKFHLKLLKGLRKKSV